MRWPAMLVGERTAEYREPESGAPEDPEAADPDDELYVLGERCAAAFMQADALTYQGLTLLAEFDRRGGWQDTGFGSTAEWLAWKVGLKPGPARERVRTALALEQLPETSRALAQGEVSFTKVRALSRVATAENENVLLEVARAGSAANLERVVRAWKRMDRKSEVTAEQLRYRTRTFSAFIDEDGMVVVRGRLDPEAGAMLMRAVEAANDALFRSRSPGRATEGDREDTTPEQRRADALGLMAERALAAGFGEPAAPVSGSRADRTQVVLHVEADTLAEHGEPGRSHLEDGTRVSAETSRRMACDTGVVRMRHDANGEILDVGRRTRTVSPSLRRALEARDGGCRFPGCGLRFTDAHHVKHWADGGETSLRNLLLLCRKHHRAVHEGGVRVCMGADQQVVFFDPRGRAMRGAPAVRPNAMGRFRGNARGDDAGSKQPPGVEDMLSRPAGRNGSARFKRDHQVPWEIEARAREALDG